MLGYFPSPSYLTGGSGTTLADLRAKLNDELGVLSDTETAPWSVAQRNAAIGEGYAALWGAGVWNDIKEDIATVDGQWVYALAAIRKPYRMELLDSSSGVSGMPRGIVEPAGAGDGTHQVRLVNPVGGGYTLSVRGWAPYVSVFASDDAVDDLPAEHNRLPLLKAKAILYRQQLSKFFRYGERQAIAPAMNVSSDVLLSGIAAAEREFEEMARVIAGQRPRVGLTGRL